MGAAARQVCVRFDRVAHMQCIIRWSQQHGSMLFLVV